MWCPALVVGVMLGFWIVGFVYVGRWNYESLPVVTVVRWDAGRWEVGSLVVWKVKCVNVGRWGGGRLEGG